MPKDAPRYLIGVGTPEDSSKQFRCGVDMFDCVLPTRNGRTGGAFTSTGNKHPQCTNTRQTQAARYAVSVFGLPPLFKKAYLRHLYQAKEMLRGDDFASQSAFFLDLTNQTGNQTATSPNFGVSFKPDKQ